MVEGTWDPFDYYLTLCGRPTCQVMIRLATPKRPIGHLLSARMRTSAVNLPTNIHSIKLPNQPLSKEPIKSKLLPKAFPIIKLGLSIKQPNSFKTHLAQRKIRNFLPPTYLFSAFCSSVSVLGIATKDLFSLKSNTRDRWDSHTHYHMKLSNYRAVRCYVFSLLNVETLHGNKTIIIYAPTSSSLIRLESCHYLLKLAEAYNCVAGLKILQ
uniref:Uncharacterized protein n=1 Tax=Glossina pallidipes TaxID=7398 RepID=A0A1A9ZGG8_GLOPL